MSTPETDVAEIVRSRLQADLRGAIKGRNALEVGVLRGLIAAIDNAGAIPIAPGEAPPRHEVERRLLDRGDLRALLRHEHAARQAATDAFSRLGLDDKAREARLEAAVVDRYLAAPPFADD